MSQYEAPHSQPREPDDEPVKKAARATGRLLLWVVIAISAIAVILGIIFLGPLGLAILVPAVIVIWLAAGASAAGPAAGV
jgi:hypothetical protein